MVISLGSEYLGAFISSPVRQPLAQFDKIVSHFWSHVRPQLKHHPEWGIVVNLNLKTIILIKYILKTSELCY